MSVAAAHKEIFKKLYQDVWNERKFEVIKEVISESHALGDPTISGAAVGPEAYRKQVDRFLAAFPDLRFMIDDTVSEKDKMVLAWRITGTHKGEFLGVPATGKKLTITGITINEISEGKILESAVIWDALGLLQEMGAEMPVKYERRYAVTR